MDRSNPGHTIYSSGPTRTKVRWILGTVFASILHLRWTDQLYEYHPSLLDWEKSAS